VTVFLNTLFLILVMAVVTFVYIEKLKTDPGLGLEATFLVMVAGILVVMIFVSLLLSRKVRKTLSPIDDILDSIEDIKQGNYNVHVKVNENNELRKVADAINLMSREIGKQVELVYQSFLYDNMTGLKNRKACHGEINDILKKETDKMAVCLLEIDNLKSISVTKGHGISEKLIKGIAERLKRIVLDQNFIYSNGGNEFLFLIPNVRGLERVENEVNKILERFLEPIDIDQLKVEVKINVGIALYPSDGHDIEELSKRCDTALFKARQAGSGKYVFYNEQLSKEVFFKSQISEQLAQAIKNRQLYLKFQPLIDNKNEIYGFEALVRWKSPTLGEISPQIFVANAEESHLIIPIGNWILAEACKAQVDMLRRFNRKFVISVNVSPVQLVQKDFINILKQIIRDTEIDPHCLVLEITEGVLIESNLYLEEIVDYLHEIGAKIALDDFGTGYASLTSLKQIPFDNLKIDKSFVDGIFGPKKEHDMISKIIQLVHSLDILVVAEGVEKRRQYEYLKQISTDVFQGFLFSKPLEYDEAVRYVDQFYKVAKSKRIDVFASKDYYD
jgi:diguanylate cyclase (GGDEF)-like protein